MRITRLLLPGNKRISFIWGEQTIIKAFKNKECSPDIKLPFPLAQKIYNEFVRLGAMKIV